MSQCDLRALLPAPSTANVLVNPFFPSFLPPASRAEPFEVSPHWDFMALLLTGDARNASDIVSDDSPHCAPGSHRGSSFSLLSLLSYHAQNDTTGSAYWLHAGRIWDAAVRLTAWLSLVQLNVGAVSKLHFVARCTAGYLMRLRLAPSDAFLRDQFFCRYTSSRREAAWYLNSEIPPLLPLPSRVIIDPPVTY
ncbi:hypothetical protein BD626DRAFT_573959 [Schizophyllum amplum]|uniref:Uncharacterized protein n=1 Tax=Schizophyllum amplum TaxID=97359 RepID=A0A550BZI7_9AGAR|nr:hypothetical protein BD626DRAFT_573959 [Auriculariopsis ampla]